MLIMVFKIFGLGGLEKSLGFALGLEINKVLVLFFKKVFLTFLVYAVAF